MIDSQYLGWLASSHYKFINNYKQCSLVLMVFLKLYQHIAQSAKIPNYPHLIMLCAHIGSIHLCAVCTCIKLLIVSSNAY